MNNFFLGIRKKNEYEWEAKKAYLWHQERLARSKRFPSTVDKAFPKQERKQSLDEMESLLLSWHQTNNLRFTK